MITSSSSRCFFALRAISAGSKGFELACVLRAAELVNILLYFSRNERTYAESAGTPFRNDEQIMVPDDLRRSHSAPADRSPDLS